ncbi:hypothetical protein ACFZKI_000748 [Campylobacter lari]
MIAYVHIGAGKTGTTSIQKFLKLNYELLLKKGFLYSRNTNWADQHWELVHVVQEYTSKVPEGTNKEYINVLSKKIEYFNKIRNEVKFNQNKRFIFSSEGISWTFSTDYQIKSLHKLLKDIGFDLVYIIVYLRNQGDMLVSLSSQNVKDDHAGGLSYLLNPEEHYLRHMLDYKIICKKYGNVFGRENIIVRLFDKNEFYQGDLLKDFIHSIGLEWDDEFQIPRKENESLDLIGFELQKRLNRLKCNWRNGKLSTRVSSIKHFSTTNDATLKFMPPKDVYRSYIDYFEESNEWVRKEFFPHKERLFPKKDLTNYKENYELKEMKPEYWDKIAEFIADIVKTKTQTITNQTSHIQNLNNAFVEITKEKDQCILNKDNLINNQADKIKFLQSNIQEKSTQLNQTQSKLSFQTKYGTAKSRIQNQLSYKLGQAMIVNSKSILGYLIMPMALLSIMISHKQEQKIYQEKIKKDPSLKLPPLEDYPDYQESLKLKNHLSYKLGQALIQANKTWYGGGVSQTAI